MDYLKFLGLTLPAIGLLFLDAWLTGAGLGLLVAMGFTIGAFAMWGSRRHAIAYAVWMVLLLAWVVLLGNSVKVMAAQHPDQLTRLRMGEGFLLLLAMILLHPLCYGAAWLATRNQPAAGTPNRPGTRRRRRYLLLTFCGAVLLALLAGTMAEYLLHISAKPFEYYLALGSLPVGGLVAFLAARRTRA